jgi:hypothetical protein
MGSSLEFPKHYFCQTLFFVRTKVKIIKYADQNMREELIATCRYNMRTETLRYSVTGILLPLVVLIFVKNPQTKQ